MLTPKPVFYYDGFCYDCTIKGEELTSMDRKTTRTLSRKLENVRNCTEGDAFIEDNAESQPMELHEYLNRLIAEHKTTAADAARRSNISKNYIYNILNGERKNPSRDKILALCVGIGAGFSQTNRALELAKYSPLYPKDERDVRVAVAINKGMTDVTRLNLQLEEYGLRPLDV